MDKFKGIVALSLIIFASGLVGCGENKNEIAYKSDSQLAVENMNREITVSSHDADAILDSVK